MGYGLGPSNTSVCGAIYVFGPLKIKHVLYFFRYIKYIHNTFCAVFGSVISIKNIYAVKLYI